MMAAWRRCPPTSTTPGRHRDLLLAHAPSVAPSPEFVNLVRRCSSRGGHRAPLWPESETASAIRSPTSRASDRPHRVAGLDRNRQPMSIAGRITSEITGRQCVGLRRPDDRAAGRSRSASHACGPTSLSLAMAIQRIEGRRPPAASVGIRRTSGSCFRPRSARPRVRRRWSSTGAVNGAGSAAAPRLTL